jgi:predicted amino acid-binding ACT domain protein
MGIVAPVSDVALLTHYNNPDDLLCDIGSGNLNARNVVEALFKKPYRDQIIQYWARETSRMENMSVPETILLGECCNPDLGVQLVAFVENSILTVHRIDCDEIMKKEKTKLLKLLGLDPYEIILTVYVRIKAKDRAGLLHDITNVLSEFSINILNIGNSKDPITNSVTIDLAIEIVYATRLIEVLHRLSLIAHAESVQRIEAPFEKMQWKVASQADISLKPESILYPVSAFEEITKQTSSETAIVNQQELRKVIDEGFSLDELVVLCADVEQRILEDRANTRNRGIAHLNLDMFGLNRPKANLITDLIQYLYRRDLLSYLLQVVNLERPGLLDKVIRYSSNKRQ